ncbi:MAG: bifunctional 5,10-methylene-tetrahydrofolate dehydrogenase/5,10-methylene-tetrahydrofolate cyclohydrolase, partial [Clostridia bacterium]|nr:bifunctional 5,10-methylene-tetrahydrofolate dehydrogenase/5,10-methylene-tetrahydrofolate cyclohydrolase [Clostridia bacterium]
MAILIDGKAVSAAERELIKEQISSMKIKPGLAVILVGEDPASQVYVRNKKKACADVGIYSESYDLPV